MRFGSVLIACGNRESQNQNARSTRSRQIHHTLPRKTNFCVPIDKHALRRVQQIVPEPSWNFYGVGCVGSAGGAGSGGASAGGGVTCGPGVGAGAGVVFWLQPSRARPANIRTNALIGFGFMRRTSISPSNDDGRVGATMRAPVGNA